MLCPLCAQGSLVRKVVKESYTYKGYTLQVDQPGEWCGVCGEGVLNSEDLKITEEQVQIFQSSVDGLLCSTVIKDNGDSI